VWDIVSWRPACSAKGACNQIEQTAFWNAKKEKTMFLMLFVLLVVLWLLGFIAFHVAGALIHLLLLLALISLVVHFMRG
jgi:bacteriorhodopsin